MVGTAIVVCGAAAAAARGATARLRGVAARARGAALADGLAGAAGAATTVAPARIRSTCCRVGPVTGRHLEPGTADLGFQLVGLDAPAAITEAGSWLPASTTGATG